MRSSFFTAAFFPRRSLAAVYQLTPLVYFARASCVLSLSFFFSSSSARRRFVVFFFFLFRSLTLVRVDKSDSLLFLLVFNVVVFVFFYE